MSSRQLSATTVKILAMPNSLTNRQVADKLDIDIEVVKQARRWHKVEHARIPRDRGYKAKVIAAFDSGKSVREVAAEVGCSIDYVANLWSQQRKQRAAELFNKVRGNKP